MRTLFLGLAAPIVALSVPVSLAAQEDPEGAPSPNAIVDAAEAEEWVTIPAEDVLVMTLAPDSEGNPREVIIQLMPAPFSQGWVENIRTLARAEWYDGISVNRVQDNYVVQWGDPNYDNPEADGGAKALPEGLKVMSEEEYVADGKHLDSNISYTSKATAAAVHQVEELVKGQTAAELSCGYDPMEISPLALGVSLFDLIPSRETCNAIIYSNIELFDAGWPLAGNGETVWPVHCYGMVGVGRNYSPDTGSGAELYTVIGHAPRHLDRNIALVGRVISGMEHLSSLPRGKGELGFYAEEEADKRTPILSVRVASDLEQSASSSGAVGNEYAFEYLSTEGETFAKYAEARANRRDPFFIKPAGGADICNIPVPVRPVETE